MPTVQARALHRASQLLGSPAKLQAYLGVSPFMLDSWLSGRTKPTEAIFLRVVDLLSEAELSELTHQPARPTPKDGD